jgi:hypothetical protein
LEISTVVFVALAVLFAAVGAVMLTQRSRGKVLTLRAPIVLAFLGVTAAFLTVVVFNLVLIAVA